MALCHIQMNYRSVILSLYVAYKNLVLSLSFFLCLVLRLFFLKTKFHERATGMGNVCSSFNFAFTIAIIALFSPSEILVNMVCIIPDINVAI